MIDELLSVGNAISAVAGAVGYKLAEMAAQHFAPHVFRRLNAIYFGFKNKRMLDEIGRNRNYAFDLHGCSAQIALLDTCLLGYEEGKVTGRISGYAPTDEEYLISAEGICKIYAPEDAPALIAYVRDRLEYWRTREANKDGVYDAGNAVHVTGCHIARIGAKEEQGLNFIATRASYCQHRTTVDLFRRLNDNQKKVVIDEMVQKGGHPFFGQNLAIALAVITSDNQLVFAQRGANTAVDPDLWACSIGEGFLDEDLSGDENDDILFRCTRRGLKEEFFVSMSPHELRKHVRFTAFGLSLQYAEWYMFGVVDLRGIKGRLSSKTIHDDWRNAQGKDRWETRGLHFVPFNKAAVIGELQKTGPDKKRFAEYGVVSAVLAVERG